MINLSSIAFVLDRQIDRPLFVQLYDEIRQRLSSGDIKQGAKLPPSRVLATELGLSRSTVISTYDQLVAEGYIEGRKGSGFYTSQIGETEIEKTPPILNPSQPTEIDSAVNAPQSHPGYPDSRLFPYRAWAKCLARTARMTPESMTQNTSPFGDPALRASIAQYLADWRGLNISPDQVLVTAGSVDALETCIRTLIVKGDTIGLEDPGYQPIRNILFNQGMKIKSLPVTKQGTDVSALNHPKDQTKMIVLTPSHQFPLGGAMPPNRRLEFQQWAEQNNGWIIEDDYDSEFRYEGRPIPAMASNDSTGKIIYVGTFSKVFSFGLRLGYLIMPPSLVTSFANTLSMFGIKAAMPSQRALSNFINSGEFYRHIRRVRRIYGERRKMLIEQIQSQLKPYITYEDTHAGMQLALKLTIDIDDKVITLAAKKKGVSILALSSHYKTAPAVNGLLLGFCSYTEQEIYTNVTGLRKVIEDLNP